MSGVYYAQQQKYIDAFLHERAKVLKLSWVETPY